MTGRLEHSRRSLEWRNTWEWAGEQRVPTFTSLQESERPRRRDRSRPVLSLLPETLPAGASPLGSTPLPSQSPPRLGPGSSLTRVHRAPALASRTPLSTRDTWSGWVGRAPPHGLPAAHRLHGPAVAPPSCCREAQRNGGREGGARWGAAKAAGLRGRGGARAGLETARGVGYGMCARLGAGLVRGARLLAPLMGGREEKADGNLENVETRRRDWQNWNGLCASACFLNLNHYCYLVFTYTLLLNISLQTELLSLNLSKQILKGVLISLLNCK